MKKYFLLCLLLITFPLRSEELRGVVIKFCSFYDANTDLIFTLYKEAALEHRLILELKYKNTVCGYLIDFDKDNALRPYEFRIKTDAQVACKPNIHIITFFVVDNLNNQKAAFIFIEETSRYWNRYFEIPIYPQITTLF